jgi:hypothetical protein
MYNNKKIIKSLIYNIKNITNIYNRNIFLIIVDLLKGLIIYNPTISLASALLIKYNHYSFFNLMKF